MLFSAPLAASKEISGLEAIYEEYNATDARKELRLTFLPGYMEIETDALLAICLVYKQVRGAAQIRCRFADQQIAWLLSNAPNACRGPLQVTAYLAGVLDLKDYGQSPIHEGLVLRVNLAEGGAYRLTSRGEELALRVVQDMVRRA